MSLIQPVVASASRAVVALEDAGSPLDGEIAERLAAWAELPGDHVGVEGVDELLAPHVLLTLALDQRGLGSATRGAGSARLVQHGWSRFLIRVLNPHRLTTDLVLAAPEPGLQQLTTASTLVAVPHVRDRIRHDAQIRANWVEIELPEPRALSGLEVEYRTIDVYARDARDAAVRVVVHAMAPSVWSTGNFAGPIAKGALDVDFASAPSRNIEFDVREADGTPCTAAVTVRDQRRRVYPARSMRLAPDMPYQDQVYRSAGEMIRLPNGRYEITVERGPETRAQTRVVEIDDSTEVVALRVDRWIEPAERGYYSGDVHIHAAGCSHYDHPTEGVTPETIVRHVRGEGLQIGNVLTWGPCFYYQKQFFTGYSISPVAELEHPQLQALQGMDWTATTTPLDDASSLRYDLEISQFPSGHAGHLILVGLEDQDYPGAPRVEDWPSWDLPILRWAHAQGATVGFAHIGLGLHTESTDLPNYDIPSFDYAGECIIDVTHDIPLFFAAAEVHPAAELTLWYHLLNIGYRVVMLGETDFPCISDDKVGVGRTYVRLPQAPRGPRAIEDWLEGVRTESLYFGDGRSHLFDVEVDGSADREQTRTDPGTVRLTATVAALLEEEPVPLVNPRFVGVAWPVWHVEHARVAGSREVEVEAVVNGVAVARQTIVADGTPRPVVFELELERSSWIAMRILPSVHSTPVFVEVGGAPVRASRRSARWLRECVDAVWKSRSAFIRDEELDEARAAYDHARTVYDARVEECDRD
jgi:hypothetical protein